MRLPHAKALDRTGSTLPLDSIVEHIENDAGRTALETITRADPRHRWTMREVADHVCIGGIGRLVVGSPATVADAFETGIDKTGLDGLR